MHSRERNNIIKLTEDNFLPTDSFMIQDVYRDKVDHVLIPNGFIEDRTGKVALDILKDYEGEPLHLLCVLKGAEPFFSTLCRELQKLGVAYSFDFIKASSYEGTESTGKVKVDGYQLEKLKGENVIIVEDIIDSGLTMNALVPYIASFGPKSVVTCALCEKVTERSCGYQPNYCCFSIPDFFVVGYGLDYNQAMRDIEHVCIISKFGIEYYKDNEK